MAKLKLPPKTTVDKILAVADSIPGIHRYVVIASVLTGAVYGLAAALGWV